jgi:hypothetical protein
MRAINRCLPICVRLLVPGRTLSRQKKTPIVRAKARPSRRRCLTALLGLMFEGDAPARRTIIDVAMDVPAREAARGLTQRMPGSRNLICKRAFATRCAQ